jgi:two-component system LytT family sensor kinase
MLKNYFWRLSGISICGILIPSCLNLWQLEKLHWIQILSTIIFFSITVHLCCKGSGTILAKIKDSSLFSNSILREFSAISLAILFTSAVIGSSVIVWQSTYLQQFELASILRGFWMSAVTSFVLLMVHEVFFLCKQRELDTQVVMHLDRELQEAEISVLKNELDPHFVYNSLMPLYYLIKNDVSKAELFANRLIQVYQYFLENRQNDFISLNEELKFIRNYFYLLEIRFNKSIQLTVRSNSVTDDYLVLPFSLQLLVENAIRHNELDSVTPLEIRIEIEKDHITVANNIHFKPQSSFSSRIGLNNLRSRYKILCNCDISVIRTREIFSVKLPLKRKLNADDIDSYHRGRSYQF